jgi:hypothetical protein
MAQVLSFGQALNEAKQIIVQQSTRIRADADKIRIQQQTIVDQCATVAELERKNREQNEATQTKTQELAALQSRLLDESTARAQADAVVDRQGQRITSLQNTVMQLETQLGQQSDELAQVRRERDEQVSQLTRQRDEQVTQANNDRDEQAARLSRECEALRQQLPSSEDEQALAAMTLLLSRKTSSQRNVENALRISPVQNQAQAA